MLPAAVGQSAPLVVAIEAVRAVAAMPAKVHAPLKVEVELEPEALPPDPKPRPDDDGEEPPPIDIDWGSVRQRAADCNMPLGEVAQLCGRSPSHFRNMQTGFRRATADDAAAIARFLAVAAPTQGSLF